MIPADVELSAADRKAIQLRFQAERERRKREGTWAVGTQAHTEYQGRYLAWIVEKLGIPEHTLRWSLNPEYQCCHCAECTRVGNAGRPHLWDGEPDPIVLALEELQAGRNFCMPSGTGTGKTFGVGACGALAFLAINPRSIVLSFAPKEEQLLLNLWKEIGVLFPKFQALFPMARMTEGKLRLLDGEGEREVWAATALGAGKGKEEDIAARLKGSHHPCMYWLIEEGQGTEMAHIKAIINTAVGAHNPIGMLGNPSHQHDPLAQFGRRAGVRNIRVSALDHPNLVCERDVIPGAVSAKSVADRLEEVDGNRDDPDYLSQVRGIAPAQPANALIKLHWLDAAAKRADDPAFRVGVRAMGIDLADSENGDLGAVSRWQGAYAEVEAEKCPDASQFGEDLVDECLSDTYRVDGHNVGIDSAGIGGPIYKAMRRRGLKGLRPLNGGARPMPMIDQDILWGEVKLMDDGRLVPGGPKVSTSERFDILRSQILWLLAEDLRLGRIALKYNKELWEELTAITKEAEAGKIWVHEKKVTRKLLGRSPDRADSLAYGNFVRRRSWLGRGEVAVPAEKPSRNVDRGLERMLARHEKRMKQQERQIRSRFGRGRGAA